MEGLDPDVVARRGLDPDVVDRRGLEGTSIGRGLEVLDLDVVAGRVGSDVNWKGWKG